MPTTTTTCHDKIVSYFSSSSSSSVVIVSALSLSFSTRRHQQQQHPPPSFKPLHLLYSHNHHHHHNYRLGLQNTASRKLSTTVRIGTTTSTTTTTTTTLASSFMKGTDDYYNNNNNNERWPSQIVIDAVEKQQQQSQKQKQKPNEDFLSFTPSDISTISGISLTQSKKELTLLASLIQGDISVSYDGELIYLFPISPSISSILSSSNQGMKYKVKQLWKTKIYPYGLYLTKIMFGLILLTSLVAIFSTIFFVMTSSSSGGGNSNRDDKDDNDDRSNRGRMIPLGGGGSGFWGPSPFDFFYYRPYYSRYYSTTTTATTTSIPGSKTKDEDNTMGFLESVFSYVFGDGNPNGDIEYRRLRLVAEMIRTNGGAVTSEQLAPYCEDVPVPHSSSGGGSSSSSAEMMTAEEEGERAYVDESFVLPIVAQLDGQPQVTEEGDIVYVFPELMTTSASSLTSSSYQSFNEASSLRLRKKESNVLRRVGLDSDAPTSIIKALLNRSGISTKGALERSDLIDLLGRALSEEDGNENDDDNDDDPTVLIERQYKFSLASPLQTILAGGLGVVNLGGALYLGSLFQQYSSYGIRLPLYMGILQQFYPLLLGYAVLFNVVPFVRNWWIQDQNSKIQRRNAARKYWKTLMERNVGSVKRKLGAAARFGKRMRQLGTRPEDVIFDTRMDFNELEKKKEIDKMKEFDQILDEKGGESAWD